MLLQICQGHTFRKEAALVLVVVIQTLQSYKTMHILQTNNKGMIVSLGGGTLAPAPILTHWIQQLTLIQNVKWNSGLHKVNKPNSNINLIQVRESCFPLFWPEAQSFLFDLACHFFHTPIISSSYFLLLCSPHALLSSPTWRTTYKYLYPLSSL